MKTAKLNDLFDAWRNKYEFQDFVTDGIISEQHYEQQKIKILFVLKDAHIDRKKNKPPYDLRKDLKNPMAEGNTWNNIARWTRIWLDDVEYSEVVNISALELGEQLCRIAAMNLKKEAGGPSAKNIQEYAAKHRIEIIREIEICEPDIIIACGTFYELKNQVFKKNISDIKQIANTNYSIGYIQMLDKRIPVVDYFHPQCRKNKEMLYEDMRKIKRYMEQIL